MTGCTTRDQRDPTRHFFRCLNSNRLDRVILDDVLSAFREAVFSINYVEVLFNHEVDSDLGCALFTRLRQENHVSIQCNVITL